MVAWGLLLPTSLSLKKNALFQNKLLQYNLSYSTLSLLWLKFKTNLRISLKIYTQ